jgi:hypothetical protein
LNASRRRGAICPGARILSARRGPSFALPHKGEGGGREEEGRNDEGRRKSGGPRSEWRRWGSNPSQAVCKTASPPWHMRPHAVAVIPDGVEPPSPGCKPGILAAEPRDRRVRRAVRRRQATIGTGTRPVFTAAPLTSRCQSVAEVGVEPTKSPASGAGRFAGFAYSAVIPGHRSRTWPAAGMSRRRALAHPVRVAEAGFEPA